MSSVQDLVMCPVLHSSAEIERMWLSWIWSALSYLGLTRPNSPWAKAVVFAEERKHLGDGEFFVQGTHVKP